MNKRLKAEIWEVQIILYWILALGLYETGHTTLYWFPLVWSFISIGGWIMLAKQAVKEEREL